MIVGDEEIGGQNGTAYLIELGYDCAFFLAGEPTHLKIGNRAKGVARLELIAHWSPNEDTPRYWAVDQPANRQAWRRGRKRYWIEPGFRDWKSYGFDLERSHLDDPERLQVLLLGIAVTTLWLIHLGEWVTATGRRLLLEASHKRGYSLFRLGRDYVQRCRTMTWTFPIGFTVHHPLPA